MALTNIINYTAAEFCLNKASMLSCSQINDLSEVITNTDICSFVLDKIKHHTQTKCTWNILNVDQANPKQRHNVTTKNRQKQNMANNPTGDTDI